MSIVFSHQNFNPPKRCPPCLIIFIEIYIWCHHKLFRVSVVVIIAVNVCNNCRKFENYLPRGSSEYIKHLQILPLPILVGTLTLSCCRVQNSGRSTNYLWFNTFVLCEGGGEVEFVAMWRNGYLSGQKWVASEKKYVWPDNLTGVSRDIYSNLVLQS